MSRKFDLNIDKVLETWEPAHAIRELISNALDEQILTDSPLIQLTKDPDDGSWLIRDFGRGLAYEHLIQSENPEKLNSPKTIGKFGVGLKDALATLWRHDVHVVLTSKHGEITLERSSKHAFEDILTLHACVSAASDAKMVGTSIRLSNCKDSDIALAKKMFLHFRESRVVETTQYGQVISNRDGRPAIYLNGLQIASEDNFLFSYNITSPNAAIRKSLNRERMNVGRAAYTDRVKSILLCCGSSEITKILSDDLQLLSTGGHHDELAWLEIQAHACQLLNARKDVVFVTAEERTQRPSLINHAKSDGLEAVTIPERLMEKVSVPAPSSDAQAAPVRILSEYAKIFNNSFQYSFVPENRLSSAEQNVYRLGARLFPLIGGRAVVIKEILISETMRPGLDVGSDADGVWESNEGRIIIKRSVLSNEERFLGVLLHEIAHAQSGASDINQRFEQELTALLGKVAKHVIGNASHIPTPVHGVVEANTRSDEISELKEKIQVMLAEKTESEQRLLELGAKRDLQHLTIGRLGLAAIESKKRLEQLNGEIAKYEQTIQRLITEKAELVEEKSHQPDRQEAHEPEAAKKTGWWQSLLRRT